MIVNFRKTIKFAVNDCTFEIKTDRNHAVYEISPRIYITKGGTQHDTLSVVRGQNPVKARESLVNNVFKWEYDE